MPLETDIKAAHAEQEVVETAGQEGSAVTTTSWERGCGTHSSMRSCIYMPVTMAGRPRSVWFDSS